MPAPSSSRIDPVIGHLAELVGGAADDSPGGLLAVLANMADPRHHRRGPPPVQPAHPRHPAPGMPRALVRLETPPPGQRPHVALRPPEPTSQTAVVVLGASQRSALDCGRGGCSQRTFLFIAEYERGQLLAARIRKDANQPRPRSSATNIIPTRRSVNRSATSADFVPRDLPADELESPAVQQPGRR